MNHQLTRLLTHSFQLNQTKNLFSIVHHSNSFSASTKTESRNYQSTRYSTKTTTQTTAYHIGKSGKQYSPWLVNLVTTLGNGLGYNLPKSHAITITSDLYDHCSNQFQLEKSFWINQCGLPDSFQTWFQITQLHLWIIIIRLRCLKENLGKTYIQELVNHAFIDTEHRIRSSPYKVTKNSLVKGYMKTLLDQHYGFLIGFDLVLATEENESDRVLVEALWRNLFGANWGNGMGGVKGIFNSNDSKQIQDLKNRKEEIDFFNDVKFVENLERISKWIRIELIRVNQISDEEIINYQKDGKSLMKNKLIDFGKL